MLNTFKELIETGIAATSLIKGSTSAVKGALDLLREDEPDLTEIKTALMQSLDDLLETKAAQAQMQDEIMKLEDELRKRDRFQQQEHRYALTKTDMGGLVRSLKPEHADGEPAHDLCTACFDKEVKSVLQPVDFNTLGCPICKSRVYKSDGRTEIAVASLSRDRPIY
ncbi:MAG: hypothetical protein MRY81_15280 [Donghicola eburneus]|nr:hypothetical protein [Donghicola eburneus]MCI5041033.1 hypothetical protein [Donghicola eburneus]